MKKIMRPDGFIGEFYSILREKSTQVCNKLPNIQQGIISNLVYEASVSLIPKSDKEMKTETNNSCE